MLGNYHRRLVVESKDTMLAMFGLPDLIARQANERHEPPVPWDELTHRARKRLRYKAKKWLNTTAVERMTVERLAARDPDGEVRSWLATIGSLAAGAR